MGEVGEGSAFGGAPGGWVRDLGLGHGCDGDFEEGGDE